jgi:hypothetical protein
MNIFGNYAYYYHFSIYTPKTMAKKQKKIIFLMPYFGHFPEWFSFYLESCRWNPTIDWLFFTDCLIPKDVPSNVRFIQISFEKYQQLVSERLDINFKPESPYKLCDVKPAYGHIHQEYIEGYDYFGFGDVDVIYGNLRAFYTDDILRYNTLSTHLDRVSGHLFLMKNDEKWINSFRRIPNWQQCISQSSNVGVDEGGFSKVLRGRKRIPYSFYKILGVLNPYKRNHLFQERFSTILSARPWLDGSYDYPDRWFWHQGKLTVESGEELMYLHFMNWKSTQYQDGRYKDLKTWESLSRIVDPHFRDLAEGFCISHLGFTPLSTQ